MIKYEIAPPPPNPSTGARMSGAVATRNASIHLIHSQNLFQDISNKKQYL